MIRMNAALLLAICLASLPAFAADERTPPAVGGEMPAALKDDVAALGSADTQARVDAAGRLGKMGAAAAPAIPTLMSLLRDRGLEMIRQGDKGFATFGVTPMAAAAALSAIGAPAVEPLRAALHDPASGEDRALWAARALAWMKEPATTRILLDALKQPDHPYRSSVAVALGASAEPEALEALLALAAGGDSKLRKAAVEGLAEGRSTRAVDALVVALRDPDVSVRGSAAGGLIRAADPRAFEALVVALGDGDATVRNLSAQALGALKDRRAAEPLVTLMQREPESLVRFQIGRALEAITGQKHGEDASRWRKWWEKQPKA